MGRGFFIHTRNAVPEPHILSNSLFPPGKFAMMSPNVFGDWMKVLVEKSINEVSARLGYWRVRS
jgi:hypothetical protein